MGAVLGIPCALLAPPPPPPVGANVTINGDWTLAGNATGAATTVTTSEAIAVSSGNLTLSTNTVLSASGLTVGGGALAMSGSGSSMLLDSAGKLEMTSGTISTSDLSTAPILSTNGTQGTNFFGVSFGGGTLDVDEWEIHSLDQYGVNVGSGVTITDFNNVSWGVGASPGYTGDCEAATDSRLLSITGTSVTLSSHVLPDSFSGAYNVRCDGGGASRTVTMQRWEGAFGGPDREVETGSGTVSWGDLDFVWVDTTNAGDLSVPIPNIGSPFASAYVTAAGDTRLYVINRTDGTQKYSYEVGGSVGNLTAYAVDSATNRLFVTVDDYKIAVLTDDGSSLSSYSGWSTNPKSFGESGKPISAMERVREGGTSGTYYLYFIVSSYENNENSLYKVDATDGSTDDVGANWPLTPANPAVSEGFATTSELFYSNDNVYAWSRYTSFALYRIPSDGGAITPSGAFDTRGYLKPLVQRSYAAVTQLYAAPEDDYLWKLDATTMTTDVSGVDWTGGKSNDISTGTQDATSPSISIAKWGNESEAYLADGENSMNRLSITGVVDWSTGLTGQATRFPILNNGYLYFGTDQGVIYCLNATTGADVNANFPFTVKGGSAIQGWSVDAITRQVYFSTANGRLYQFNLQ
jgi:hypothetical protein